MCVPLLSRQRKTCFSQQRDGSCRRLSIIIRFAPEPEIGAASSENGVFIAKMEFSVRTRPQTKFSSSTRLSRVAFTAVEKNLLGLKALANFSRISVVKASFKRWRLRGGRPLRRAINIYTFLLRG